MKTVILCGGHGTRLSEETIVRPKPMVEIGGMPILLHIMKTYAAYGQREFVLALGYKGEMIKEFFVNYHAHTSDITVSLATGDVSYSNPTAEDWLVHLISTGSDSMTGGRLLRLKDLLKPEETFMLTYGDGVADIDIDALLKFHRKHGRIATVTAVQPKARFGGIQFDGDSVVEFKEKPEAEGGWINGGYFVFEPHIFDYLHGDQAVLEKDPLENLAKEGQLMVFKHQGFWQCMDTLRDKNMLEDLWNSANVPWVIKRD